MTLCLLPTCPEGNGSVNESPHGTFSLHLCPPSCTHRPGVSKRHRAPPRPPTPAHAISSLLLLTWVTAEDASSLADSLWAQTSGNHST